MMVTAYARLLLAASLLVILAPAQPQSKKPPNSEETIPSIKVDVDVVNILCSVRNKAGGLVGNLCRCTGYDSILSGIPETALTRSATVRVKFCVASGAVPLLALRAMG